jgi:AraC-like DNA-binding protein
MIVENDWTILQIFRIGDGESGEEISMIEMTHQPAGREAQRVQASREELAERIARILREDGRAEPLEGLRLRRASSPMELGHGLSDPALCVIAQGRKEIWLGETCFQYDPAHYLISTDELPVASRITEASKERPYLGLVVKLDSTLVGSVIAEAGHSGSRSRTSVRAIHVSPLDAGLLEAAVRLVRLLETPTDARFLAPLVTREIVYRLLNGEQGDRLRHIAALGGQTHRIGQAINRLRREFDQPLRIDDIARELGMSVSGFHHHFKNVTALSPLQFRKQLRLQEARRLMLGTDLDAASAGYRVGYHDASHFNREYKSLFGAPPLRDVELLRGGATQRTGL